MVELPVLWNGVVDVGVCAGGLGWGMSPEVAVDGSVEGQSVSVYAGLRRLIDTVSLRPWMEMVKCVFVRLMTGYGPS